MAMIRVKAAGKAEKHSRTVFDQAVGPKVRGSDERQRVIVRSDGVAVLVDSTLKVVKDAIERGDLEALDAPPEAPAVEKVKP